jgi:hypothetical protein
MTAKPEVAAPTAETELLAARDLSLANRHQAASINDVFAKNILLNLAYLEGSVSQKSDIDWSQVTQPFEFGVTLNPGQTFAYHDDVLDEYQDSVALTTNTYFHAADGYLSSGFLYGDGVCHLASIINWAAQDAGLEVVVTKLHSIAPIPDVPDEYGVSIYTVEGVKGSGARNNLYITNNQVYPVEFRFIHQDNTIRVELHRK